MTDKDNKNNKSTLIPPQQQQQGQEQQVQVQEHHHHEELGDKELDDLLQLLDSECLFFFYLYFKTD